MSNHNQYIIRRYKADDVHGFFEAVIESKSELAKWLPWCHENYSIEESEQWILEMVPKIWDAKIGHEFIIIESETNEVIGGCCLEQLNLKTKEANIGYWIRTSRTNRGIATHACHFLLNFGFNELGLKRIHVIPSIENPASRQVAEKLPWF